MAEGSASRACLSRRPLGPTRKNKWSRPKYEKAALRWLERYLTEGSPRLQHFAEITMSLAKREP